NGADGMHAGYLPGYPASHGCVRMPEQLAIAFFNSVGVGTPVTVFGRTPTGSYTRQWQSPFMRGGNRFADPRFDPRFAPPPPFPRIHDQLQIRLINCVESHPINARFFLITRQALF